jgi:hypothetical protein
MEVVTTWITPGFEETTVIILFVINNATLRLGNDSSFACVWMEGRVRQHTDDGFAGGFVRQTRTVCHLDPKVSMVDYEARAGGVQIVWRASCVS